MMAADGETPLDPAPKTASEPTAPGAKSDLVKAEPAKTDPVKAAPAQAASAKSSSEQVAAVPPQAAAKAAPTGPGAAAAPKAADKPAVSKRAAGKGKVPVAARKPAPATSAAPAAPAPVAVASPGTAPSQAQARPALRKPARIKAAKPRPAPVKPVAAPSKTKPVTAKTTLVKPSTSKAAPLSRPLPNIKDKTMAANTFDFASAFKTAFAEFQGKAKTAYEKGSVAFTEANDFAKGNVEAVVESGKILASGLQELGTSAVAESRSAFDGLTADVKAFAAVKSPTEFFQLQSALMRKQFDAAVAQTSKSTEAMLKLANDTMAPLSNRVTLAVEKVSKVA